MNTSELLKIIEDRKTELKKAKNAIPIGKRIQPLQMQMVAL